ncbi:hypothetical protein BH09PSE2_BH09PSE2_17490 [soil metagenome]
MRSKATRVTLRAVTPLLHRLSSGELEFAFMEGEEPFWLWIRAEESDVFAIYSQMAEGAHPELMIFALAIDPLVKLQKQIRQWTPPQVSSDTSDFVRNILLTRPSLPPLPERYEPFKAPHCALEVVRTIRWVAHKPVREVAPGATSWIWGASAQPPTVEVEEWCSVDVGLLFHHGDQRRTLVALDWSEIVVLSEGAQIDAYLASCSIHEIDDLTPSNDP